MYGEPLGECAVEDVMPLVKLADVLQCPKLQNDLVDVLEGCLDQEDSVAILLTDAYALRLPEVAETFLNMIPMGCFKKLDIDLLETDNLSLMRAVARRTQHAAMLQWERFIGHGEVYNGNSVALAMASF